MGPTVSIRTTDFEGREGTGSGAGDGIAVVMLAPPVTGMSDAE
ncbi:hypothetical protein [Nocardiopsis coralli]|nr:hypothetical protein [Nocardiopsis coralli]